MVLPEPGAPSSTTSTEEVTAPACRSPRWLGSGPLGTVVRADAARRDGVGCSTSSARGSTGWPDPVASRLLRAGRHARHGDARRHRRRGRRQRAVPRPRPLLPRHADRRPVGAHRHARRRDGPPARHDQPVRRLARLDLGPGGRLRGLLLAELVVQRGGRRPAAVRRLPLLPGRGRRRVVRQGARRGPGDDLQRRHRRAVRAAGAGVRRHGAGRLRGAGRRADGAALGAGRGLHRHGGPAGRRGAPPGRAVVEPRDAGAPRRRRAVCGTGPSTWRTPRAGRVVRALPERTRPRAVPPRRRPGGTPRRPGHRPAAPQPGPGRRGAGRPTSWSGTRCAPTRATGARCSGCP